MDILGKKENTTPSKNPGVKAAAQLKEGSVMDFLGKKTNNEFEGLKPATQLKSGSVMDILGKSKKDDTTNNNIADKFKPASGSWECPSCMIQNKCDAAKCVACETNKPVQAQKTNLSGLQSDVSLVNKFKPPSGNWECEVCMISNKADVSKCAACETPKPGGNASGSNGPVSTVPVVPADAALSAKFKPVSGSWECPTCMIQNNGDKEKCVACETDKPGAKPAASSVVRANLFLPCVQADLIVFC